MTEFPRFPISSRIPERPVWHTQKSGFVNISSFLTKEAKGNIVLHPLAEWFRETLSFSGCSQGTVEASLGIPPCTGFLFLPVDHPMALHSFSLELFSCRMVLLSGEAICQFLSGYFNTYAFLRCDNPYSVKVWETELNRKKKNPSWGWAQDTKRTLAKSALLAPIRSWGKRETFEGFPCQYPWALCPLQPQLLFWILIVVRFLD